MCTFRFFAKTRKINGTISGKICNVDSICCEEIEFSYQTLIKFYWLFNSFQQNLCVYLTGYWTIDWPPGELCATDHNPLSLIIQPTLHQFVNKDVMVDGVKTETLFAKVKSSNIHCSTLIHQASYFVTESHDVFQAWFPPSKSMLTVPNHFLVLNKFVNGFQSYMLHRIPWDRGEANQLTVLQILIPDLVEKWHGFLPVLRNLPRTPWPFKDNWDNGIVQLLVDLFLSSLVLFISLSRPPGIHQFLLCSFFTQLVQQIRLLWTPQLFPHC